MDQLCREPRVDELLRDPVARLLMKRDGVDEAALRRLLEQVGRRLGEARDQPTSPPSPAVTAPSASRA